MYGITDNGIVDGLGKPTIKFEFETNDELKRFLSDNKENLIENYVDVEYTDVNDKSLNGIELGSVRLEKPPKKIGIGYKVFVLKNGKLYPPMVANPNGEDTPIGVWLNADTPPIANFSKTGRPQVKQGGKGTQGGSGFLAYRPGWHLGIIPYAIQFNRKDEKGNRTLFPKNFVWAECEYAADVNYQKEADKEGYTKNGKFIHSYAGLKRIPENGYYIYRTNPNPATDPFIITGAMRVKRILSNAEVDKLVLKAGRTPQRREGENLKGCLRGLGKPPADIFNVSEDKLKTFGFSPTYERLTDYSHLIDSADHTDQLTGYGFDGATLKTLVNVCQKYRYQVAKLADHLKADTPEQSAFNIWHWLHCNVKYNYDTAGKEEIRTPARSWADRERGVDCDCLSVFTACLLLDMGYSPKFEIVAFSNKPQYSHIFINLNGMAIDRVLPMFNRRPSLITKTMTMDIPVYQLSGVEDTAIMNGLNGLYTSTLSKIAAGTATKKDRLNFRKTQVLVTLQGADYNAFRLAGLLMPYVTDIDNEGNYYFDNEEIADIAVAGENELIAEELRGADENTLGKLFKKIGKALKKAAKKVASGVKKVAKSTAKAVKTVAKQTAKVTKAAVKSAANAVKATANVVKAGAQAATGKGAKAKATLKKAGQQVKKAVTQPVKAVAKATKEVVKKAVVEPVKTAVKVTVINPTKTIAKGTVKAVKTVAKATGKVLKKALKIAGKVFKVIFVKLNPLTVLMRNSLRMLVAINFLGMATKFNIANLTKDQAIAEGYTEQMWNDAKKAKQRVVKFFTKLGGKEKNIEKAIVNGSKKKAIFKKDYNKNTKIVENGEDDATLSGEETPILTGFDGLGDPGSIGAALASVGAFIGKIWGWIKNIVPKIGKGIVKVGKAVGNAAKKTGNAVKNLTSKLPDGVKQTAKDLLNTAKDTALNKLKDKIQSKAEDNLPQEELPQSATKKSNLPLILGITAGALTVGAIIYAVSKNKKAA